MTSVRLLYSSLGSVYIYWHLWLLAVFFCFQLFCAVARFIKCLMMPACGIWYATFSKGIPFSGIWNQTKKPKQREKMTFLTFSSVCTFSIQFFLYSIKFSSFAVHVFFYKNIENFWSLWDVLNFLDFKPKNVLKLFLFLAFSWYFGWNFLEIRRF